MDIEGSIIEFIEEPIEEPIKEPIEETHINSITDNWNEMVGHLISASEVWEQKIRGTERETIDNANPKMAKMLSVYRLAKFDVMIMRFADYWRGAGGLAEMLII